MSFIVLKQSIINQIYTALNFPATEKMNGFTIDDVEIPHHFGS